MKCSHCRILILTFVINLAWNSQNLTQKHSVIDSLNILEPNCGICSHRTWKVLMTCMYLKAIYTNGVSRKKRIRLLRRWIYSNNFSVWFDWISTYSVLFIYFIASLFFTITISYSYHPHSFLVCGWVLMLWWLYPLIYIIWVYIYIYIYECICVCDYCFSKLIFPFGAHHS